MFPESAKLAFDKPGYLHVYFYINFFNSALIEKKQVIKNIYRLKNDMGGGDAYDPAKHNLRYTYLLFSTTILVKVFNV